MRIIELELRTARLAEMKVFYSERLGFALADITEHSITIIVGGTRLTFVHEEEGRILPSYHLAMNIPKNQIREAKSWLLDKGCQVLSAASISYAGIQANEDIAYFEGTDAHAFYFEDPSENLVEFIARHRMDNASTEPFDHESILNVSEIGLPLHGSVSETIQRLNSRFDVTRYIGDGKTFQMLGDEYGMFILGDMAIGWYPSMKIPEVHPIRMTILDPKEGEFQLDPYPYTIRAVSERPV
ncbi:VOC family protein [Paenibacillus lautus]|uniref:VOC family protein n=1 Tax=Paenibacillus lautus TaxID=1401 RepID=UPI002DB58E07|nr:VOC family protein [Paenibacillus lautus]MEC0256971.1 glyoxalase [Paenibacillus lautus]